MCPAYLVKIHNRALRAKRTRIPNFERKNRIVSDTIQRQCFADALLLEICG